MVTQIAYPRPTGMQMNARQSPTAAKTCKAPRQLVLDALRASPTMYSVNSCITGGKAAYEQSFIFLIRKPKLLRAHLLARSHVRVVSTVHYGRNRHAANSPDRDESVIWAHLAVNSQPGR